MQFHKTMFATTLLSLTALLLAGCNSTGSTENNSSEISTPSSAASQDNTHDKELTDKEEYIPSEEERAVVLHPDDEFPGLLMGDAGPDIETSWLDPLSLTGEYMADLESLGFSYDSQEHLEALLELYDDRYCANSLTDPVNRMALVSSLEGDFSTDNVDFARTYVAYNCPGRAETIDRLFIYIEANQD